MACDLCAVRKPRRFCPGVRGEICSICCGTEREVSVYCPLDCPYLEDARRHERVPEVKPEAFPNRDVRVTQEFLAEHDQLFGFMGQTLLRAALETPGMVDNDIREGLDALIRTYRTLESGVYYETRPNNPLAGAICAHIQQGVTEFRNTERQQAGIARTRDVDVLGILVFLEQMEIIHNNGRARGRAFIDFLRESFGRSMTQQPVEGSPLIVP